MRKTMLLNIMVIFALLVAALPASAARDLGSAPGGLLQASAPSFNYLLTLPVPAVQLPQQARGVDAPGYFAQALQNQQRLAAAVLDDLKASGQVQDYQFQAKANAFLVQAGPQAAERLAALGALAEIQPGRAAAAAVDRSQDFQGKLGAAIQSAQAAQEQKPAPPSPVLAPAALGKPQPVEHLVTLDALKDRVAGLLAQERVAGALAFMQQSGDVSEFTWMQEANSFRVTASLPAEALKALPGVAAVALFSPSSLDKARAAYAPALLQERQALAKAPSAPTATTPVLSLDVFTNIFYATSSVDTSTVFTLTNSAGEPKNDPANTAIDGWYSNGLGGYNATFYLYGQNYYPVYFEPGDELQVNQQGQAPFTLDIPDLRARVDREADTITGIAPVNITSTGPSTLPNLYVHALGINHTTKTWEMGEKYLTTGASGEFSTALTGGFPAAALDLQPPNTSGWLQYLDANGNSFLTYFFAPFGSVREHQSYVSGHADLGSEVTVTLRNASGVKKGEFTDSHTTRGIFSGDLLDAYGNPVNSEPGDVVRIVSNLGTDITIPVVDITAHPDSGADTVSGVAPANIAITDTNFIALPLLRVCIIGCKFVTTDGSGAYLADNFGDFSPGALGTTDYVTADGDQVYRWFQAPFLAVRGNKYSYSDDSYVSGVAIYTGSILEVALKRGGATLARRFVYSDAVTGQWGLYFYDVYGNPMPILGGDQVEVTESGETRVIDVPVMTAGADPDTELVTGIAPANITATTLNAPHSLYVYTESPAYTSIHVTTSAAGAYTADFSPYDGINPGAYGGLRYTDPQGNFIYQVHRAANPQGIEIRVRGSENRYEADNFVGGQISSPDCGPVFVTLKSSSGGVKAQFSTAYYCGDAFTLYLNDAYGNPANILAGDTLEVSLAGVSGVVEVPSFEVTSDAATDTVQGSTDAVVIQTTPFLPQTLGVWPSSFWNFDEPNSYVLPDASGEFEAVFPGEISPGSAGHLLYIDAEGNKIYTDLQAPQDYPDPVVAVKGYPADWGYTYQGENYLAISYPDCGVASMSLKDSAGETRYTSPIQPVCGDTSYYLNNENGAVNIHDGDLIEITFEGEVTQVKVPALTASADAETDVVSGIGPADVTSTSSPTHTLGINVSWPSWETVFVTTNQSGGFSQDFTMMGGIDPGTEGSAFYTDPKGNIFYSFFMAPYDEPHVYVHKDGNRVLGYVTQPGADVTLSVKMGAAVKATAVVPSDRYGFFEANFYSEDGVPVLINEGDEIVMNAPDEVAIAIPHLEAGADVDGDLVTGEAPAGAQLNVQADGKNRGALSDADGAFTADFRDIDINPGDEVMVEYLNEDGQTVYIQFYAGPQLFAQLNSPYAWGIALDASSPVTLTLKTGATVKGVDVVESSMDNEFFATLTTPTGQPASIAAGDTLQADFGGGRVSSMTVTAMTAGLDINADTAGGSGPANALLGLEIAADDYYINQSVLTDASGKWSADPGAEGIDIRPGALLLLRHKNTDQNETWLFAAAPVVYLRSTSNSVYSYWDDHCLAGIVAPYDVVDITLKRGGAIVASTQERDDDGSGYFETCLMDSFGQDADIMGGDQVVLSGSNPITIDVPVLQATPNVQTGIVTGFGPPGADLGIQTAYERKTVRTAADGTFSVALNQLFSGLDVYLRYRTPAGHWVLARFSTPNTGAPYLAARWNYDEGVVCGNCVYGQAGKANTVFSLALRRGGSLIATVTGLSNSDGYVDVAFTNASDDPVDILAADVIEMTASGSAISMTVPTLTAQANPDSDVLFGSAPASAILYYYWWDAWTGWADQDTGEVGPDGKFFFDHLDDLYSRVTGYIRYTDSSGNQTYLAWGVPYVSVWENGNEVNGILTPGQPVTVRLLNAVGGERANYETTSDGWGGWFSGDFYDGAGHPVIIQPGDTVVVEAGEEIRVPVVPLQASVDIAADKVTGRGPAGEEIQIQVETYQDLTTRIAAIDDSGAYTADFSGEADLQSGNSFIADYWNEDGNNVYLNFMSPLTRVNTANDLVDGYATPNHTVHLALKRSGTLRASADVATDMNGFFSAYFLDTAGKLVDILAGDVVEVTASPTTSSTVANLTAAINVAADQVTGSGPANEALMVKVFFWTGWNYSYRTMTAYTNASGAYVADFAGQVDLTGTSYAYVRYTDAQGSQTAVYTPLSASPLIAGVEEWVEEYGTSAAASAFGMANSRDLTPPVLFNSTGGTLVFMADNASLVITYPDGSVNDSDDNEMVLYNAKPGVYQVQVRAWTGEGGQYAFAIGVGGYKMFMPVVEIP